VEEKNVIRKQDSIKCN